MTMVKPRSLFNGPGVSAQTAAVFVSKAGNDSNTGRSISSSKLTLGSALTAASGLITDGATGVRIEVMDGGEYDHTPATILVIPANVHVFGPAATFVGRVGVSALSSFQVDKHFPESTGGWTVRHNGGNGPAVYKANILDNRGQGGAFTGGYCVRNNGDAGKNLFVEVGVMYVPQGGVGVGDTTGDTPGHIHIKVADIYLAGNNAVGLNGIASGTNIVGWVDHILEIGTPTGTVGINMLISGAKVALTASEIIADTAYNITAGDLYLSCPKITGTQTGAPVFISANGMSAVHRVVHGATAGTARPAVTFVEWIGSVDPSNAVNNDTWDDTSASVRRVRISGAWAPLA